MSSAPVNVASWYAGKNIFITGVSGFLGICLLEKILRTIPDVGTIYVLLRPKKGKEINERLDELKKNLVFERLLESKPVEQVFSKVVAVAGDVGSPSLGLSADDRQTLVNNVNVIIHSAATLDFAEGLKPTTEINLLGTRKVLELAARCVNFAAFVHISSAYVNSWQLHCDEVIYPLVVDPEHLISLVSKLSEEELEKMTPEILGDHPNTYTITKQMAEHEVQKMESHFPCTIVRPSMIIGAWKEPKPGWTISKNGPQGFLMGASKGVIRRLPVGKKLVYDYIPVDVVVNQIIVAGFHAGITQPKKVEVYHCTSSTRKPFRWVEIDNEINPMLHTYPLKSAVWYPRLKLLPTITWFKISALFVHFLPALILDTVTRLSGGRPILMRMHRNVNNSIDRLQRFIFTEWMFDAPRTIALHNWLLPDDKEKFILDISRLSWRDMFDDLNLGVRRYLNKEEITNLKAARSKLKMLALFHFGLQAAVYVLLWFLFACLLGSTMKSTIYILVVIRVLLNLL